MSAAIRSPREAGATPIWRHHLVGMTTGLWAHTKPRLGVRAYIPLGGVLHCPPRRAVGSSGQPYVAPLTTSWRYSHVVRSCHSRCVADAIAVRQLLRGGSRC